MSWQSFKNKMWEQNFEKLWIRCCSEHEFLQFVFSNGHWQSTVTQQSFSVTANSEQSVAPMPPGSHGWATCKVSSLNAWKKGTKGKQLLIGNNFGNSVYKKYGSRGGSLPPFRAFASFSCTWGSSLSQGREIGCWHEQVLMRSTNMFYTVCSVQCNRHPGATDKAKHGQIFGQVLEQQKT